MNIAGIDVGVKLGIAVVELESEKIIHIEQIDTKQLTFSELFCVLNNLVKLKSIRYIGYEKPIYHTNIKSMQKYIEKTGTLKLIASINKIPIVELHPNSIKKSFTTYGKASKHQVRELIKNLYNITLPKKGYDISDAIAISFSLLNKLKSSPQFMSNKNF